MAIYVYTDQPEEWQPGENTIIYLPFKENKTEIIHDNQPVSSYGASVVEEWVLHMTAWALTYNLWTTMNSLWIYTISQWVKPTQQNAYSSRVVSLNGSIAVSWTKYNMWCRWSFAWENWNNINTRQKNNATLVDMNQWQHLVVTVNNGNVTVYKNALWNSYGTNHLETSNNVSTINVSSENQYDHFTWYISEAILENRIRTTQEVTDYFNGTKSNYGIS